MSCKVGQGTKYFGMPHMVAQPSGSSWLHVEDSLVIGLSLLVRDSETHCIQVMNLSDMPHTLYQGAQIGDVDPVTFLKQAHEVFEADPQLSDCHSKFDSDDEELLDVYTADTADFSGIHSCPYMHTDMCMDPKDLLEHLQPLREGLAEDPTLREHEELAAAIYGCRDVFNSSPANMGQTDLVAHMIDTGEHRPIRFPPR